AITVATHPGAVVLPAEAVVAEEGQRSVFVVDLRPGSGQVGVARQLPVAIGFDGGDWLEIASGLKGDQRVVVSGIDLISAGAPVGIPERAPPAHAGGAGGGGHAAN